MKASLVKQIQFGRGIFIREGSIMLKIYDKKKGEINMSFVSWHTYGYGIRTSGIDKISVECVEALVSEAPKFEKNLREYFEEQEISSPEVIDYLEYDQEYRLGIASLLKEVIEEAEEIRFTACDDLQGDKYLLYEPSYPWNLPEKERGLTEEKIKKVLMKYVKILTDADIEYDYYSPENGG